MRALILAALVAAVGCGGAQAVTRVVDGREIAGRYIEPEAYADFLRGVLAQERGDYQEALRGFASAAERDGDEPEIWVRYAAVRCAMRPGDPEAERALDRALARDSENARALAVRASCALGRNDAAASARAAEASLARDPRAVDVRLLLARALERAGESRAARSALVTITAEHGELAAAWDALGTWAESKGDYPTAARAWAELARVAPHRRTDVAAAAVRLAGMGDLSGARAVAGAALDAPADNGAGRVPVAAARLAIDQALFAQDGGLARARATRGHVPFEEVSGRAWLIGAHAVARETAELVASADPGAAGARIVAALAAERAGDPTALARSLHGVSRGSASVSAATACALAAKMAQIAKVEDARSVLDALHAEAADADDVLVTPVAVELAAMGILREETLSPNALVELAARRREAPRNAAAKLDPRHRLLASVLTQPIPDDARALALRLNGAVGRDPIVTFAVTRLALAEGRVDVEPGKLLATDPTDPLLLGVAVDVAKTSGKADAAAPFRSRLTAVARTPAERALGGE